MPPVANIVFITIVVSTGIVGSLLLIVPAIPVAFLCRPLYHAWVDAVCSNWYSNVALLMEAVLGIKVYTAGESMKTKHRPKNGKRSMILCNHRTRFDWMLLWPFFARSNINSGLRIVLKKELASIPVFGWATQACRFLFLSRKWEQDREHMRDVVRYWKQQKDSSTILIFPEGTDLSESNVAKSHEFCKKNDLPCWDYVLYPRSTGTQHLLRCIGKDEIDEILDLTMGFEDYTWGERPSEACLLNGRTPPAVHFHLRSIPVDSIPGIRAPQRGSGESTPEESKAFAQWMENLFLEKERMLKAFYANPKKVGFPTSRRSPLSEGAWTYLCAIVYWATWGSAALYCVWHRPILCTLVLAMSSIVAVLLTKLKGGMHMWMLEGIN